MVSSQTKDLKLKQFPLLPAGPSQSLYSTSMNILLGISTMRANRKEESGSPYLKPLQALTQSCGFLLTITEKHIEDKHP